MQLFLNGSNVFGALPVTENLQPVAKFQTLPLSPAQIKAGTYTCPTLAACPPAPKWPWILAAITGVAVGTGITVAAVGSRDKKR